MYVHEFGHPASDRRNGLVKISVIARPLTKERKHYQNRLRLEALLFDNPKENSAYIELRADDGIFLAEKLQSVVKEGKTGKHKLLTLSLDKVSIELFALIGEKGKDTGITIVVDGEKGKKEIAVNLTKTRMRILAEMMKAWCLYYVPQIAKSRSEAAQVAGEVSEEASEEGMDIKGDDSIEEE